MFELLIITPFKSNAFVVTVHNPHKNLRQKLETTNYPNLVQSVPAASKLFLTGQQKVVTPNF